jgi:hypothetical protein
MRHEAMRCDSEVVQEVSRCNGGMFECCSAGGRARVACMDEGTQEVVAGI